MRPRASPEQSAMPPWQLPAGLGRNRLVFFAGCPVLPASLSVAALLLMVMRTNDRALRDELGGRSLEYGATPAD